MGDSEEPGDDFDLSSLILGTQARVKPEFILNPTFPNLRPSLKRYEDIIPDPNVLLPLFSGRPNKKLRELPGKGKAIIMGDIHGDLNTWETGVRIWLNQLKKEKKTYFVPLGDLGDARFEYDTSSGSPVVKTLPLESKEGKDFFEKNLAIKDEQNNRFMILAYPDESVQIYSQVAMFRRLVGDLILPVLGDHDMPLIFPEYRVAKDNVELTNNVRNRLTKNEAELLKTELSELPLVITAGRYGLSHTGPAILHSKKQLEDLVLEFNIDKDDPEFDQKYLMWLGGSIPGRFTFNWKHQFPEAETDAMMRILGVNKMIYGHSGTKYDVDGHKDLGKQIILATTEGKGCEKARIGERRTGPNMYGEYVIIDLETGNIEFKKLRDSGQQPSAENLERYIAGREFERKVSAPIDLGDSVALPRETVIKLFDEIPAEEVKPETVVVRETISQPAASTPAPTLEVTVTTTVSRAPEVPQPYEASHQASPEVLDATPPAYIEPSQSQRKRIVKPRPAGERLRKTKQTDKPLLERFYDQAKVVYDRGGLDPAIYGFLEKNQMSLQEELKINKKLEQAVTEGLQYLVTTTAAGMFPHFKIPQAESLSKFKKPLHQYMTRIARR